MSVLEAVERDLKALGPEAVDSSLAATARALAEGLDGQNSLTSKSLTSKELRETMRELRALAPPKKQEDRVDQLAKRRELRIAAAGH